jgi:hypothetical protein
LEQSIFAAARGNRNGVEYSLARQFSDAKLKPLALILVVSRLE